VLDLSEFYEAFPYPPRDPEAEVPGKTRTVANDLRTISHYLYAGERTDFRGFRALVAGGGTGDVTVQLAQQLATIAPDAQVTQVDLSAASTAIAKRRIEKLGLSNVRFVQGSLLDPMGLGLDSFDYIDCSGVLHHLPDPLEGARILASLLKPNGGMSIMLYGALGRVGIYNTQEMLRMLGSRERDLSPMLDVTRALLASLPDHHLLRLSPGHAAPDQDDAELVDKFLHVRDRAYRVAEIYDLLSAAGLRLAAFLPPIAYDPLRAIADPVLQEHITELSEPQRHAFAELFHCGPMKHIFFAVPIARSGCTVADPDDLDLVPATVRDLPSDLRPTTAIRLGGLVQQELRGLDVAIVCAIDGRRSVRDIFSQLSSKPATRTTEEIYRKAWTKVFHALNGRHILVLTRKPLIDGISPGSVL
jgi:SAM-dependent methyltransferase